VNREGRGGGCGVGWVRQKVGKEATNNEEVRKREKKKRGGTDPATQNVKRGTMTRKGARKGPDAKKRQG